MIDKAKQESLKTLNGLTMFVESFSLLVVSVFSVYAVYKLHVRTEYTYVVMVAALVIGLRGAWEFVRHLRRLGAE